MNILSRQTVMMLLLAVLFFAPGLAALYFYQNPQLLGGHSTNKGDFLHPPLLMASLVKPPASTGITANMPKWSVVLWRPEGCDASCMVQLDQLARVRLALGRRYYEVDEVLLMPATSTSVSSETKAKLQEQRIAVDSLSPADATTLLAQSPQQRIFIANPQGFLVLSYAVTAESDDVYHDLKQLLMTTQTKSK